MTSRWPSVVRSATFAPFRSRSALVATVVPWTMRSVRASSVARSRPSVLARSVRPSINPSEGSAGVEALFAMTTRPDSSTAARSVNVPPTSMPMRNRGGVLRVQRALELPQAARQHDEDRASQLRHFGEERLEIAAKDDEQPHVGLGAHGGRARLAVEEAHLAEELAGAEADALAPRHVDHRRAVEDEEELLARLAHAREHGPRRHLDHARDRRHRLQLLLRAVREDVDLLQVADLFVLRQPRRLLALAQQVAEVPSEGAVEHAADEFHRAQPFCG